MNGREIIMFIGVQRIGEQLFDITAAVATGRQADTMDHQQIDIAVRRSLIMVRGKATAHARKPDISGSIHCSRG